MKKNTHLVIRYEDVEKYLSKKEREELKSIVFHLRELRKSDGVPDSMYYVCNINEPYADVVRDVLICGEKRKEIPETGEVSEKKGSLLLLLDVFARFRKRYHFYAVNMSVLGGGFGFAGGYDGKERTDVKGKYEPYE